MWLFRLRELGGRIIYVVWKLDRGGFIRVIVTMDSAKDVAYVN